MHCQCSYYIEKAYLICIVKVVAGHDSLKSVVVGQHECSTQLVVVGVLSNRF
jgi:hypothetical protein